MRKLDRVKHELFSLLRDKKVLAEKSLKDLNSSLDLLNSLGWASVSKLYKTEET